MASPGKKSFLLRLDPQVWARLERLAAADLRSVNAEVEFLLREALKRRGVSIAAAAQPEPEETTAAVAKVPGAKNG
ncbi:MAG: hypothetical protein RJB26_1248 [Pseudomonadota bacterium]